MGRVTLKREWLNSMDVKVINALSIVATAAQNYNNTAAQNNIASNSNYFLASDPMGTPTEE